MNNNVGAIGSSYTQGLSSQPRPKKKDEDNVKQELQPQQNQPQKSSVSPKEALDFEAAKASYNAVNIDKSAKSADAQKVIKISDYVTPEQAKRIAGFVTGFENEIAKYFDQAKGELPNISDEAALDISAAMFASENF